MVLLKQNTCRDWREAPPLQFSPSFQWEKISITRERLRGAPAPLLKNSPSPNILTFEVRAMWLFGEGDKGGEVKKNIRI